MTSPYAQFKTDDALETEGVILDYGDYAIRIARAGGANKRFGKVLDAKRKPYARQIQNETLDDEVARKLMAEAYADAIVLGWGSRPAPDADIAWGSIPGPDGQPMPFTRQACVKLFLDLPDLFADIREQSAKVALFRREDIEEAAKNSAAG